MGVGKYTPNDAISGDMGWRPPCTKQWSNVLDSGRDLLLWKETELTIKFFNGV